MNQELSLNQLRTTITLVDMHLEGLSEWQPMNDNMKDEYNEYNEIRKTLNKMIKDRESVDRENIVEIHGYVDQLISNDNGEFDNFGSSYLLVPKDWATEMVINQGFKDLKDYFSSYTYDDTIDLIDKAIEDGVLLGVGTGLQPHLLDGGN